jgi:hypothetical protein
MRLCKSGPINVNVLRTVLDILFRMCNNTGNVPEARSPNHCCRGKAISITCFCVCMRARVRACLWGLLGHVGVLMCLRACSLAYAACNGHSPCCTGIGGLSGSTTFFDII